jgi:hypothetical protein
LKTLVIVAGVASIALVIAWSAVRDRVPASSTGVALGYTSAAFESERTLERRFRQGVSSETLSDFHAAVTR